MDSKGVTHQPVQPITLDSNNSVGSKKTGKHADRKVQFKSLSVKDLFLKSISALKSLIERPFQSREIKVHNQALVESRINKDIDRIMVDAYYDMDCYDELNLRMDLNNFNKDLIKDKDSDEIHKVLLKHGIITETESKGYKENAVDLEGSPYQGESFICSFVLKSKYVR